MSALCGAGYEKGSLMFRLASVAIVVSVLAIGPHPAIAGQSNFEPFVILVAGPAAQASTASSLSPEERMQRRHPQAVKVADLIGLPVLDDGDRTLGRVKSVVRTSGGKILLIVPFGGFLGFRQRLVAVPIEVVAIAGRQIAALDMPRGDFDAAPTWNDPQSQAIPVSDTIRIGLYRR